MSKAGIRSNMKLGGADEARDNNRTKRHIRTSHSQAMTGFLLYMHISFTYSCIFFSLFVLNKLSQSHGLCEIMYTYVFNKDCSVVQKRFESFFCYMHMYECSNLQSFWIISFMHLNVIQERLKCTPFLLLSTQINKLHLIEL